jgi:hypothetical protein
MDHPDHVNLLKPADLPFGGIWADFGAGSGAFTLALRVLPCLMQSRTIGTARIHLGTKPPLVKLKK